MEDENEQRRTAPIGAAIFLIIALLIGLLFMPLMLAAIESVTSKTHHVEDFCRTIGVYDFLTAIYRPLIQLFGAILS